MCIYVDIVCVILYSFSQRHIFAILMFLFSVMKCLLKMLVFCKGEKNQKGNCSPSSLNYLYYVNDSFPLSLICVIFLSFLINLFIFLWLCWVFVATCGLSLVAGSRGYSSLRCAGFSLLWLLLLQSTGSRPRASVVVACGLSSCGSRALEHRLSSCGAQA